MAKLETSDKHWFFGPVLEQKSKFVQLIIASLSINLLLSSVLFTYSPFTIGLYPMTH